MHTTSLIIAGFCILAALILALSLQNQRRRAKRLRLKFRDFEGEEQRMFAFLSNLGLSIEKNPSLTQLSRIIVDGTSQVVSASGGSLYFLREDGEFLYPAYLSENCPPLIEIPDEVRAKSRQDPQALESYLRLTRIPREEGLLGSCLQSREAIQVFDLPGRHSLQGIGDLEADQVSALLAPLHYAGKALGVLAVTRTRQEGEFTSNDFAVFRSVAEQSSFAIGNARIHREASEKRAMESELRTAREVQRILLPQQDPVVPGFRISGTNLPARIISGDYYDYIDLDDGKLGIVIADVSGKGVPAGLLMAMCRSALRSIAPGEFYPSKALSAVNRQLFPDIREDMFITLTYGVLDRHTGRVLLARAGHDPALLYRKANRTVEPLRSPGLALGIDAGLVFERVIRDQEIAMEPGDCILFYTDGVKEAVNENEEEFGLERMSAAFLATAPLGVEVVLSHMQEALRKFSGEGLQMDDITLVAIERH